MTIRIIGFNSCNDELLNRYGASRAALAHIFFGPDAGAGGPGLATGCPDYIQEFATREFQAAELSYRALEGRELRIPDPWTGDSVTCLGACTTPGRGELPYMGLLPLLYRFHSRAIGDFWLVAYAVYGRITHVFAPSLNVMFHLNAEPAAQALGTIFESIPVTLESRPHGGLRTAVVLDLVNNFGHQMMNYLSGIDRLIATARLRHVDEIWVSGVEFFRTIEAIFPEIRLKVRRFATPWEMYQPLQSGQYLPIRACTNIYREAVGDRLLRLERKWPSLRSLFRRRRSPVVALTVRTGGRVCRNLTDALSQTIRETAKSYRNMGVIIDGWVIPDHAHGVDIREYYGPITSSHLDLARALRESLPDGMVIANTIGQRISQSVSAISEIDAYVSHVGTLQHKLAFITGKPGVVHGPRAQLAYPDTGHFQTDKGIAPMFLRPESVSDIAVHSERGDGFNDYDIVDVQDLTEKLCRAIRLGLNPEP